MKLRNSILTFRLLSGNHVGKEANHTPSVGVKRRREICVKIENLKIFLSKFFVDVSQLSLHSSTSLKLDIADFFSLKINFTSQRIQPPPSTSACFKPWRNVLIELNKCLENIVMLSMEGEIKGCRHFAPNNGPFRLTLCADIRFVITIYRKKVSSLPNGCRRFLQLEE